MSNWELLAFLLVCVVGAHIIAGDYLWRFIIPKLVLYYNNHGVEMLKKTYSKHKLETFWIKRTVSDELKKTLDQCTKNRMKGKNLALHILLYIFLVFIPVVTILIIDCPEWFGGIVMTPFLVLVPLIVIYELWYMLFYARAHEHKYNNTFLGHILMFMGQEYMPLYHGALIISIFAGFIFYTSTLLFSLVLTATTFGTVVIRCYMIYNEFLYECCFKFTYKLEETYCLPLGENVIPKISSTEVDGITHFTIHF